MIETEKYLESVKNLINSGTKIEKIKNLIIKDRLHEKISFETYIQAIKIIEELEKKVKPKIEIKYITDPKEEQKIISMMQGKHPIEVLPETEIDER